MISSMINFEMRCIPEHNFSITVPLCFNTGSFDIDYLEGIGWQRLSLDINISTKYVYVRKHTHNKNEKATEIMFCECNEN